MLTSGPRAYSDLCDRPAHREGEGGRGKGWSEGGSEGGLIGFVVSVSDRPGGGWWGGPECEGGFVHFLCGGKLVGGKVVGLVVVGWNGMQ